MHLTADELPAVQTLVYTQPELWAGAGKNRVCGEIFLLGLHSFMASLSPDFLVLILVLLIAGKKQESLGSQCFTPISV